MTWLFQVKKEVAEFGGAEVGVIIHLESSIFEENLEELSSLKVQRWLKGDMMPVVIVLKVAAEVKKYLVICV